MLNIAPEQSVLASTSVTDVFWNKMYSEWRDFQVGVFDARWQTCASQTGTVKRDHGQSTIPSHSTTSSVIILIGCEPWLSYTCTQMTLWCWSTDVSEAINGKYYHIMLSTSIFDQLLIMYSEISRPRFSSAHHSTSSLSLSEGYRCPDSAIHKSFILSLFLFQKSGLLQTVLCPELMVLSDSLGDIPGLV